MRVRNAGGEAGQSLLTMIFGLTAIVVMVAMVIDLGMYFYERRRLQTAMDAAALAGAVDLPGAAHLAAARAQEWAARNGVGDSDDLAISVTSTYATNDTIGVSVKRQVKSFFARVLRVDSLEASAMATARIGSPAGMNRFVPLAALNSTLSGLRAGDPVLLKYDSQTQTNGNTLALAFPGLSGGSDFRNAIYNGSAETFCTAGQEYEGCVSAISTEPGAMVGPTQQGLRDRLRDTSPACDTFNEVFYQDPANSTRMLIYPECNPFPPYSVAGSRRVVLVPVIDSLCNGRCDVRIVRFAMVFMNEVQCSGGQASCQVTAQFAEAAFDPSFVKLGAYQGDSALKFARLVE